MKFNILISETLQRRVSIDAQSEDEAIMEVKNAYRKEKIVLDYADFIGVNISLDENTIEEKK